MLGSIELEMGIDGKTEAVDLLDESGYISEVVRGWARCRCSSAEGGNMAEYLFDGKKLKKRSGQKDGELDGNLVKAWNGDTNRRN